MTIATLTRTSHIYDYAYTVAGESRTLRVALQPEVFTVDNLDGPDFYTAACFAHAPIFESVDGIAFEEGDSEHNELETTLAALNADDVDSLVSSIKADIGHVVAEAYEAAGESSHDGYTLSGVIIGGRGCPDSVYVGEFKTPYDANMGWWPQEFATATPDTTTAFKAQFRGIELEQDQLGRDLAAFKEKWAAAQANPGATDSDGLRTEFDSLTKRIDSLSEKINVANGRADEIETALNVFSEALATPTRGVAPATPEELEARNTATITPNATATQAAPGNDFNM